MNSDHHAEEPWLTPRRLASLVAVLLATYCALVVVRALRSVLIMLLVALFLAFAMEPAVQFLAHRGIRRGLATGAVFLVGVVIVAAVVIAMIPLVVEQISDLIVSVPRSVDDLNQLIEGLPFLPNLEVTPDLRAEIEAAG